MIIYSVVLTDIFKKKNLTFFNYLVFSILLGNLKKNFFKVTKGKILQIKRKFWLIGNVILDSLSMQRRKHVLQKFPKKIMAALQYIASLKYSFRFGLRREMIVTTNLAFFTFFCHVYISNFTLWLINCYDFLVNQYVNFSCVISLVLLFTILREILIILAIIMLCYMIA